MSLDKDALDGHITGNFGMDQFTTEELPNFKIIEDDDGEIQLQSLFENGLGFANKIEASKALQKLRLCMKNQEKLEEWYSELLQSGSQTGKFIAIELKRRFFEKQMSGTSSQEDKN